MDYTSHKCCGYNIGANFLGNEDYIITGSEDCGIYIYNKLNGCIEKRFTAESKIVHLVKPLN